MNKNPYLFLLKLHKNSNIQSIKEYITYEILRKELKDLKIQKKIIKTNTRRIDYENLEKILKKYEINFHKYISNNQYINIYSNYIELIIRKDVELYFSFNNNNSFFQYILTEKELENLLKKNKFKKNLHNITLLYGVLLKSYPTESFNYTEETIANALNISKQYLNKIIRNVSLDRIYNFVIGKDLEFQFEFDDRLNKKQYKKHKLAQTSLENLYEESYFLGTQLLLQDYLLFKTTITNKNRYINNNLNYRKNKYKEYYKKNLMFYTKFHKEFILLSKKYFKSIQDFEEPIKFHTREKLFKPESKLIRIKSKHQDIARLKLSLYFILKNIETKIETDNNVFQFELKFQNIKLLKKRLYLITKQTNSLIIEKLVNEFFKILKEIIKNENKYNIKENEILESNFIEYIFLDKISKYKLKKKLKNQKDKKKKSFKMYKTLLNNKKFKKKVIYFIKQQLNINENIITNKQIMLVIDFLINYGYTIEEIEKNIYNLIYINKKELKKYLKNSKKILSIELFKFKDEKLVQHIDLNSIINNEKLETANNSRLYNYNIHNTILPSILEKKLINSCLKNNKINILTSKKFKILKV